MAMKQKDAAQKLCPFRFNRGSGDSECIVYRCMMWIETANDDWGYCSLAPRSEIRRQAEGAAP